MNYFLDRSMVVSLAIIDAALMAGIVLLHVRRVLARRSLARQGPACPQCRYNMSHLDRLECPECGHKVSHVSDWTRKERQWGPMLLVILARSLLLYSLVMLWFVAGYTIQYVRVRSLIASRTHADVSFDRPGKEWDAWRRLGILSEFGPLPWIRPVSALELRGAPVTDNELRTIASIGGRRLFFDGSTVTSAGLVQLKKLKRLQDLTIENSVLDSASVQALADIPSLEAIYFENARFNGTAMQNLANAKSLTRLYLIRCAVDVGDLQTVLASLPYLEQLELIGSTFQGRKLAGLNNAPSLSILNFTDTNLGDDCLDYFGDIPRLYYLYASKTKIQGPGLAKLKNSQVESINHSGTAIGDDCVELLADIPKLYSVDLQNTRITDAGLKKLASHPTPQMIYVSPGNCSKAAVDEINAVTPDRVMR